MWACLSHLTNCGTFFLFVFAKIGAFFSGTST